MRPDQACAKAPAGDRLVPRSVGSGRYTPIVMMTTKTFVLRGLLLCGMLAVVLAGAACAQDEAERHPLHRNAEPTDPSDVNGKILNAVGLP